MYDYHSSKLVVSKEVRELTDPVLKAFYTGYDLYCKFANEHNEDLDEHSRKFASLRPYWEQRFKELMDVAELNDPEVWYAIGLGIGSLKHREEDDKNKRMAWFLKAAEAGHVDAMYSVGIRYKMLDTPDGYAKGREWLQKAASLGKTNAMCSLGFMYRDGDGIVRDTKKALEWFHKAADAGDVFSILKVAQLYAWSNDARDPILAVTWYKLAIEAGCIDGLLELGELYDDPDTDIYEPAEAVKCYFLAANNDKYPSSSFTLRAMMALAKHCRDGIGIDLDREDAKQWLCKVISGDHQFERIKNEAQEMLTKIEQQVI